MGKQVVTSNYSGGCWYTCLVLNLNKTTSAPESVMNEQIANIVEVDKRSA